MATRNEFGALREACGRRASRNPARRPPLHANDAHARPRRRPCRRISFCRGFHKQRERAGRNSARARAQGRARAECRRHHPERPGRRPACAVEAQLRDELELRRMRQDQHRLDSTTRRVPVGFGSPPRPPAASPSDAARVAPSTLLALSGKLRDGQQVFAATGGLHGAAIFTLDGTMLAIREDVGRHNAVDKLIGYALTSAMVPLAHHMMMVSGRLSFEIVQKAAAAGVPILAAVSAPSSLAVELADEIGTTLVGFLRDGSFNIYTRPDRILARE